MAKITVHRIKDEVVVQLRKESEQSLNTLVADNPDQILLTEPEDLIGHPKPQAKYLVLSVESALKLAGLLVENSKRSASND